MKFLDKAFIPIVKLTANQAFQNIKVDITFKPNESIHLGNECVELVKQYMQEYT